MPAFAWINAYDDAIRESDPARQNTLAGLAVNECTRRLSQVSLLSPSEELDYLRIALADLKVVLHLSRKYGT